MNLSAGGQELQPSDVYNSSMATLCSGLTAVKTCGVSARDCRENSRKKKKLMDLGIVPVTAAIKGNSR